MGNEGMLRQLLSDEYLRVLLTIEMPEEPPEIWFDEISHMSGLEANVQLDPAPDHRDP